MTDIRPAFRDRQITVHHFAGNALVVCPRCNQPARVFTTDGSENFYQARQWRVVCRSCAYHRDKTTGCLTIYRSKRGTVCDPVFGHPLWLQKSCCGGNLLWAYNLDHLSFVESFVAATIRERSDAVRSGTGYRRRMSMIAKLPAWLKSAKHRDELLKTIHKLKNSLPTTQQS